MQLSLYFSIFYSVKTLTWSCQSRCLSFCDFVSCFISEFPSTFLVQTFLLSLIKVNKKRKFEIPKMLQQKRIFNKNCKGNILKKKFMEKFNFLPMLPKDDIWVQRWTCLISWSIVNWDDDDMMMPRNLNLLLPQGSIPPAWVLMLFKATDWVKLKI